MSRSRKRQAGVTLIELLVAVAVMFVIAAIAIPAYTGYVENAERQVLISRVEAFRMFQDNWRIDNGTYFEGQYESGGVNDFAAIGYRVEDDTDGIRMEVEACDGGVIENCYKVTATSRRGHTLVWQNATYTWL